jgi:hypothetical protein
MSSIQISFLSALGRGGDQSYENLDRKRVTFRFRGLRDLNVIHDDLEHGAELSYREEIDLDESAIQKWIASKEELGVFQRTLPSTRPDYRSRDVIEEMYERFPHLRPEDDPQSSE